MRRIIAAFCVVAVLFSFCGCQKTNTHSVYELTISALEIYNNSVGDDWRKVFTCDGRIISSGERWTVELDSIKTLTVDIFVTENDKYPDIGSGSLSVILRDGFEASTLITVAENKGRYKGNKSQWKICCKVELVK